MHAIGRPRRRHLRRRTRPAALVAQLRQQALILQNVRDSIIVTDRAGRTTYWNEGATALFGYTAEEMLGRTPAVLYPDQDPARLAQDLALIERGRPYVGEWQARHKDGTLLWIDVKTTMLHDTDGTATGYIAVAKDITARKQAEAALLEREWRDRVLPAENTIDLITRHAPDGTCLYASPACQAVLGCTPQELIAGTAAVRVYPDGEPFLAALQHAVRAGPDRAMATYRLQRADGQQIWIETVSRAIRNPQTEALVEMQCCSRDITARTEAEEALRTSEGLLSAVVTSAPIVFYALDAQGTYLLEVGRGLQRVGRRPNSLVGQSIFARHQGRRELLEAFERALAGESVSLVAPSHDGTVIAEHRMGPLRDAQGRSVGVTGVATDVTDRVRAEQALRESEARQAALLNALPDLLFRITRTGEYLDVRAAREDRLVVPRDAIIGHTVHELLPPDIAEASMRSIARTLETGTLQVLAYQLPLHDGVHHFEARLVVNGPDEVLSIVRDITERKQAETTRAAAEAARDRSVEALRQREQTFRTLFEAAPIGICVIDAHGRFVRVNDAYCNLTGYRREEVLHMQISDLHSPEERAAHMAQWRARFAARRSAPVEFTLCTKAGERRAVLGNAVTVGGANGQPLRFAFVVDITAHRQMEDALQQANAELRRATQVKDDFLRAVSHELRTPLTSVLGFVQLLQMRGPVLDEGHRAALLERIAAAANRQVRLVHDLLDATQVEAQGFRCAHAPFAVRPVLEQAAAEVRDSYAGQRVDLHGPEGVVAEGDAGRTAQVVVNLIDNAAKYSPEGRPVAVTWSVEDGQVVVRVRDWGPGIPEEGREQLFTRFGRLAGSQMRAGRSGTGLGLYLSRALARAMDGALALESTGANGSTFRLRLPAVPQGQEPAEPAPTTVP